MSQLTQVKESVGAIAKQAKASGGELSRFGQGFKQQADAVTGIIGGSSQSADQKVVQALQQATQAVQNAVQALEEAAKTAESYANSI
jgi:hypothetical protein